MEQFTELKKQYRYDKIETTVRSAKGLVRDFASGKYTNIVVLVSTDFPNDSPKMTYNGYSLQLSSLCNIAAKKLADNIEIF